LWPARPGLDTKGKQIGLIVGLVLFCILIMIGGYVMLKPSSTPA
jgi:hypothetical protein